MDLNIIKALLFIISQALLVGCSISGMGYLSREVTTQWKRISLWVVWGLLNVFMPFALSDSFGSSDWFVTVQGCSALLGMILIILRLPNKSVKIPLSVLAVVVVFAAAYLSYKYGYIFNPIPWNYATN